MRAELQKLRLYERHLVVHLSGCDYSNFVTASADMKRAGNYHPAGTARPGSEPNGAYGYQAPPRIAQARAGIPHHRRFGVILSHRVV